MNLFDSLQVHIGCLSSFSLILRQGSQTAEMKDCYSQSDVQRHDVRELLWTRNVPPSTSEQELADVKFCYSPEAEESKSETPDGTCSNWPDLSVL
jgi:hypothetical protein